MKAKTRIASVLFSCILVVLFGIPIISATYLLDISINSEGTEAFEAIMYTSDNGIMVGMPDGNFYPEMTFNRAQLVTMLYSMAGSPPANYSIPFTDVPPNKWYTNAVCWAYHFGITYGTDDTTFSPFDPVTRQQVAVFLYRYATIIEGLSFSSSSFVSLGGYSDGYNVSSYAQLSVQWALTYCIIQPDSSNMIYPRDDAIRRDVALFVCRYKKNAVGFFRENRKYDGSNVSALNDMTTNVLTRLYSIIDDQYSPTQAIIKKYNIQQELNNSSGKCTGISFANFLDATGRHDFNRAVGLPNNAMGQLGSYVNNSRLRSAINFYQLGNSIVNTHRTIAITTSAINQFCIDISTHGPTIVAYYWYEGTNHSGHCVIVTKARQLNTNTYEFTLCDPNHSTEKIGYYTIANNTVTFYGHTISSFEYYSYDSMQTIKYLDIDGQYNTLAAD